MRFNKTVKALAVVLPIMALSACSSSDMASEDTSAMQKNQAEMAEQKAREEAERVKVEAMQRANAIEAKKRPLSSMTPTIVLKNGEPYIATGTPGGSKIITSVFQQLVNVLYFEMNIAEATNAPRVHHQWQPDVLSVERNIPADTVDILKAKGYDVKVSSSLGSLQAIMKHNGVFLGAADPRSCLLYTSPSPRD